MCIYCVNYISPTLLGKYLQNYTWIIFYCRYIVRTKKSHLHSINKCFTYISSAVLNCFMIMTIENLHEKDTCFVYVFWHNTKWWKHWRVVHNIITSCIPKFIWCLQQTHKVVQNSLFQKEKKRKKGWEGRKENKK